MAGQNTSVFGICRDLPQLETTVQSLRLGGFRNGDISVFYPNRTKGRGHAKREDSRFDDDIGMGAGAGIVLGGVFGFVLSICASLVHGPHFLVATGPVLASLAGGGIGCTVGGLIGALLGGEDLDREPHRESGGSRGILLSIHTESPEWAWKAKKILTECQLTERFSASEPVSNTNSSEVNPRRSSSGSF